MEFLNIWVLIAAALLRAMTPGPATATILAASAHGGRRAGVAAAAGMTLAALIWAALAIASLQIVFDMATWFADAIRYGASAYLAWLAFTAVRSALRPGAPVAKMRPMGTVRAPLLRGLAVHLSNPNALLFWSAAIAVGVSPSGPITAYVLAVIVVISIQGGFGLVYAFVFSSSPFVRQYGRLRRWFELVIGFVFGGAAVALLMKGSPSD